MGEAEAPLFRPANVAVPARELSLLQFLAAIRSNALRMFPRAAYEVDSTTQPFLGRTRILLNAPEAVHRVLVENHRNYRRSRASVRILRPLVGQGLLLSEGDEWKWQRRTTAPAIAPRTVPLLLRHVASATADAIARLGEGTHERVDLLAAMQTLALEIAGGSMFSIEMGQHGPRVRALLAEFGLHYSQPHLLDMLLPRWVMAPRDVARRRFHRRWMALLAEMLGSRLAEPASVQPRDLLDLLLAARDPDTGRGFSPTQLQDQVATLIVAGHETTALALFWSLFLLASDPPAQAWLREEVGPLDLRPESAGAAISHLVRTRAVVSEALRLFPPAFTVVREAIAPDEAGGVPIPTGAVVMIAPWVLHRHRRFWNRPDDFDPRRFLPGAPPLPRLAYLPFGAGPRVCVGAHFALAEATLVLALLVQAFRIDRSDAVPVLPRAVVMTVPDRPPGFRLVSCGGAMPVS
ncbi:MAG: cytochrome P450 [Acetobacteraceae bacterium]|nr:cytochrome P450 [Acetobacteraceae bacterium]